jgi:EAL domain-containing protein (putative c-di-GMP-specific phosphodiesterase class I)
VRFALDDFGTGYSSLSYLQSFPFDKIKIDRKFVSKCVADERSQKLLGAMAGVGRALELETVAEGVETVDMLNRICALGCTEAQGYLFSPAVAADKLEGLFARQWFDGVPCQAAR